MTDRDRVLRHLQKYGSLSPLEFDGSRPVVDGGKPIKRVAARVKELRDMGFPILTQRKNGMGFYVLPGSPYEHEHWPVDEVVDDQPAQLFAAPSAGPRHAIIDEAA